MVRKLKYHEQKLLKKVDFVQWKSDNNVREAEVIRRYQLTKRDDYVKYNKLCGHITALTTQLASMPADDPVRQDLTEALIEKLYNMGIITTKKSLAQTEKMTVSSFCRRRLPVVLVKVKMAQTIRDAVKLVEQGHVRVGPEMVTDPAFLVTRTMEDFVTWVDTSKVKRHVAKYNDQLDDFDLM
ncbi:U3 small nucleolar ribonucleoprotein IMP3 [Sphaeroforma arctica JP610]|uniref:U3 small nucleolar ribonucleoprotein protein IMP3 n=1 Tax=Sphaeroforma arctica JP610 TaxID=667725 RepID=A0A0L0FSD2_9EUKA|nr:U3 small nucleolar ribonucleoprotein IMP3 [Sphaeroforma arctica JP610]KNC79650.1 U3 small nucleolar ribonucleoprotein IMP3 [Sphaeroforma arctica JP610]|eukprot:XP_014153552.1 U3 small nucleolar ribonucleoprotein IMP3 [Sphaeroforma arctica JP610]